MNRSEDKYYKEHATKTRIRGTRSNLNKSLKVLNVTLKGKGININEHNRPVNLPLSRSLL